MRTFQKSLFYIDLSDFGLKRRNAAVHEVGIETAESRTARWVQRVEILRETSARGTFRAG